MRKLVALALVLTLAALPALARSYSVPASMGTRGDIVTILDAKTTGTSTVMTTDYKVPIQTIVLWWNGTCSGGTVSIEAAMASDTSDTWAVITTVSAHSDIVDYVTVSVPTHSIRARVSSNVTGGGNVTIYYVGNQR